MIGPNSLSPLFCCLSSNCMRFDLCIRDLVWSDCVPKVLVMEASFPMQQCWQVGPKKRGPAPHQSNDWINVITPRVGFLSK
jgi:hypothetical protein